MSGYASGFRIYFSVLLQGTPFLPAVVSSLETAVFELVAWSSGFQTTIVPGVFVASHFWGLPPQQALHFVFCIEVTGCEDLSVHVVGWTTAPMIKGNAPNERGEARMCIPHV